MAIPRKPPPLKLKKLTKAKHADMLARDAERRMGGKDPVDVLRRVLDKYRGSRTFIEQDVVLGPIGSRYRKKFGNVLRHSSGVPTIAAWRVDSAHSAEVWALLSPSQKRDILELRNAMQEYSRANQRLAEAMGCPVDALMDQKD